LALALLQNPDEQWRLSVALRAHVASRGIPPCYANQLGAAAALLLTAFFKWWPLEAHGGRACHVLDSLESVSYLPGAERLRRAVHNLVMEPMPSRSDCSSAEFRVREFIRFQHALSIAGAMLDFLGAEQRACPDAVLIGTAGMLNSGRNGPSTN
jgi:hypothetical protein